MIHGPVLSLEIQRILLLPSRGVSSSWKHILKHIAKPAASHVVYYASYPLAVGNVLGLQLQLCCPHTLPF